MSAIRTIGLLGFGEVGQKLADDLATRAVALTAYDIRFRQPESAPSRAMQSRPMVRRASAAVRLAAECDLVVSAVTAANARDAAASILPGLARGTFLLDVNSVSPATRRDVAALVEAAGGRFVEAAVMSPILPAGIASPMLLGGPHAEDFLRVAGALGFAGATAISPEIGRASATKLCRSVIVKGLEALFAESLIAARHYGVEQQVIASLRDLLRDQEVGELARYMIQRSVEHGERRAEEMLEASSTVAAAGIEPWMSRACVERQRWAGTRLAALSTDRLAELLDALRCGLE